MERQYIFFRTGPALLIFIVGIVAIVACAELFRFAAPDQGWMAVSVVVVLTVVTIVVSFKADAQIWRKSRGK